MHIDPLMQVKITAAICSFFALGTTIYRLYKRRGRFGADDFWALFAFVTLIIQVVVLFLPTNDISNTSAFYLMGTTFYLTIWASRLSILFSIIRIEPSAQRRRLLFWVAGTFVAAALFLLGQIFGFASRNPLYLVSCLHKSASARSLRMLSPTRSYYSPHCHCSGP
ncbi:hypothetical protein B0H13DRAFT_92448 [Mycena leptocephala]|nr:hypothetical protein B0H13DRAFT_92448 [Mycena leptocephala]